MSLAIENLKFTIFGSGFDSTRNDSGSGEIVIPHPFSSELFWGAIDASGEYVWLSNGNNVLRKFKISTWEEQSHSVPSGKLYHPSNVLTDKCVLILPSDEMRVFDLKTNAILNTIGNVLAVVPYGAWDSILVGDMIYLVRYSTGQINSPIIKVDLENDVQSYTMLYNRTTMGFVDNDTIYNYYSIGWFGEHFEIHGTGLNGADQWGATAVGEGNEGYKNVKLNALCRDGKIYAPTNIGGWKMGVYSGNSAPDFDTPTPIRTYGSFDSEPSLVWKTGTLDIVYNQSRTKCAFATTIGTFYTDFDNELRCLASDPNTMLPLAISDKYVICQNKNTYEVIVVGI